MFLWRYEKFKMIVLYMPKHDVELLYKYNSFVIVQVFKTRCLIKHLDNFTAVQYMKHNSNLYHPEVWDFKSISMARLATLREFWCNRISIDKVQCSVRWVARMRHCSNATYSQYIYF
jgi:hypothetical protein